MSINQLLSNRIHGFSTAKEFYILVAINLHGYMLE